MNQTSGSLKDTSPLFVLRGSSRFCVCVASRFILWMVCRVRVELEFLCLYVLVLGDKSEP